MHQAARSRYRQMDGHVDDETGVRRNGSPFPDGHAVRPDGRKIARIHHAPMRVARRDQHDLGIVRRHDRQVIPYTFVESVPHREAMCRCKIASCFMFHCVLHHHPPSCSRKFLELNHKWLFYFLA